MSFRGDVAANLDADATRFDADALLWSLTLVLVAYLSGYASEGYEPHRL